MIKSIVIALTSFSFVSAAAAAPPISTTLAELQQANAAKDTKLVGKKIKVTGPLDAVAAVRVGRTKTTTVELFMRAAEHDAYSLECNFETPKKDPELPGTSSPRGDITFVGTLTRELTSVNGTMMEADYIENCTYTLASTAKAK